MLWAARLTWIVLAFTSAPAAADFLSARDAHVRGIAYVFAWIIWTAGLLALLAPRPIGFTALRIATTTAFAATLVASSSADAGLAILAIVVTALATPVVCSAAVAQACAQGAAYGYEQRFPLRSPFVLMVGGIPLTCLVVSVGVTTGPLLVAAGEWGRGAVAIAAGLPLAWLATRSLHGLSRRWLVIVPAGFVVADPLTLADPVLIPRERLAAIDLASVTPPEGALDLRLGNAFGGLLVRTSQTGDFVRRTGRNEISVVTTDRVLVTPLRPSQFLEAVESRRVRRQ